jgi:hypothetical protein
LDRELQPGADKLAGDDAGSDLGPGAPDEASAHEENANEELRGAGEALQSPLSVAGMSPGGGPVDENPAADAGGLPR